MTKFNLKYNRLLVYGLLHLLHILPLPTKQFSVTLMTFTTHNDLFTNSKQSFDAGLLLLFDVNSFVVNFKVKFSNFTNFESMGRVRGVYGSGGSGRWSGDWGR